MSKKIFEKNFYLGKYEIYKMESVEEKNIFFPGREKKYFWQR